VRPIVLAIGGSDSSGGAGIQADLKAVAANGGYAATVLTAVTAQNTQKVEGWLELSAEFVRAQIETVVSDLSVIAVKSGMLPTAGIIRTVAEFLRQRGSLTYVCDPLINSGSGQRLSRQDALAALRDELLPLATVITPNVPELESLSGMAVGDVQDAGRAARSLLDAGVRAVVLTGGHLESRRATDLLFTREGSREYAGEWIDSAHDHGSGCVFASALATQLALNRSLAEAVGRAKAFVGEAIRHGLRVGKGKGPTDPLWSLRPPGTAASNRPPLKRVGPAGK
jgi:hydroxymethylpyrimidine/phosphomethylpyrimidine kinase